MLRIAVRALAGASLALTAVAGTTPLVAQSNLADLCLEAERFVRDVEGMVAVTEPDTIDDWRTHSMVPGCRVTAAGATAAADTIVARGFYDRVLEAGWVRTPDPRDAPNEASLRFRRDGADCLFNYYTMVSPLNTDAEFDVTDAVHVPAGQRMYNMLVMCMPVGPAAPRGGPGRTER